MSITQSLYNIVPSTAVALGMGATMGGVQDISAGAISRGAAKTVAGLVVANIGSRIVGLPHDLVMQSSLAAGSVLAAIQGSFKVVNGIKEQNLFQALRGTVQAMIGYGAAYYLCSLPSEFTREPIPGELETFLRDHDPEIAKIYQSKLGYRGGDWKRIGNGGHQNWHSLTLNSNMSLKSPSVKQLKMTSSLGIRIRKKLDC